MKVYEALIIGAGPAGIACAVQLKRYGVNFLLLEKAETGGLLRNANLVENYPGFPQGISGEELVRKFNEHLKTLEINPVFEEALEIKPNDKIFKIKTNKSEYYSRALVTASGTKPRRLEINTDEKIYYEITELKKQDLSGKKVVIIGAGDAAFDYALNLAGNTDTAEVTILNRSNETKCLELLKKRAAVESRINYIENETVIKFNGSQVLCKSENTYNADYLLAAIGREPNKDFISENCSRVFFIGDVKNGDFRQTAIATGDGVRAAMEILSAI